MFTSRTIHLMISDHGWPWITEIMAVNLRIMGVLLDPSKVILMYLTCPAYRCLLLESHFFLTPTCWMLDGVCTCVCVWLHMCYACAEVRGRLVGSPSSLRVPGFEFRLHFSAEPFGQPLNSLSSMISSHPPHPWDISHMVEINCSNTVMSFCLFLNLSKHWSFDSCENCLDSVKMAEPSSS